MDRRRYAKHWLRVAGAPPAHRYPLCLFPTLPVVFRGSFQFGDARIRTINLQNTGIERSNYPCPLPRTLAEGHHTYCPTLDTGEVLALLLDLDAIERTHIVTCSLHVQYAPPARLSAKSPPYLARRPSKAIRPTILKICRRVTHLFCQ